MPIESTQPSSSNAIASPRGKGLGLPFLLLLLYPLFDYGRPPNPMAIPLVISILLPITWFLAPRKKWNLQVVCFLLLIASMAASAAFAFNHGSAYFAASALTIILVCICIPLVHFVDSLRKFRIFVNALIGVFIYVALWMLVTDGMGPGRTHGAQDENYASAMMCMAIPLAYFSLLLANRRVMKLCYAIALVMFVAAVVASASRGGFLGLLAVTLFCVLYSPERKRALAMLAVGAVVLMIAAGPKYWEEMGTITDTSETTADDRLELWGIAWRMFAANPVFGVGPGNYRWNTGTYQTAEQLEKYGRDLTFSKVVHSTYFEILSELGLMGTVLIATIFVRTFWDLKRLRSRAPLRGPPLVAAPDEAVRNRAGVELSELRQFHYLSLAMAGSLIGYLVPAAFVSFTYFSHPWLLIALAVALNEISLQKVAHGLAPAKVTE